MAKGLHWEWRGFGNVAPDFLSFFRNLPLAYPNLPEWGEVIDEYLWIPGCQTNVKFRTGHEDGLKFKRMLKKDGFLELWLEDPDELFPYSKMNADVVRRLATSLGLTFIDRDLHGPWDRNRIVTFLKSANNSVQVVTVEKKRQTRILFKLDSTVNVEFADIMRPQRIHSISLETPDLTNADELDVNRAKVLLQKTLKSLKPAQGLKPMGYMQAIATWANGNTGHNRDSANL